VMMVAGRFLKRMSGLLDELGLSPEEFKWQDLALCANMSTEIFYDDYESDKKLAKAVDQICLRCPVISQCYFAGKKGENGVWGGIYWNGSGSKDPNRNSHKTEEEWEAIQRKVNDQIYP
jgi:hypothetical protein